MSTISGIQEYYLIDGSNISFNSPSVASLYYNNSNVSTNISISAPNYYLTNSTDCLQVSFTSMARQEHNGTTAISNATFNSTTLSYEFSEGNVCYGSFVFPPWYSNGTNITVSCYLIPVVPSDHESCNLTLSYHWDVVGETATTGSLVIPFELLAVDNGYLRKVFAEIDGTGKTCQSAFIFRATSHSTHPLRLLVLRFDIIRKEIANIP